MTPIRRLIPRIKWLLLRDNGFSRGTVTALVYLYDIIWGRLRKVSSHLSTFFTSLNVAERQRGWCWTESNILSRIQHQIRRESSHFSSCLPLSWDCDIRIISHRYHLKTNRRYALLHDILCVRSIMLDLSKDDRSVCCDSWVGAQCPFPQQSANVKTGLLLWKLYSLEVLSQTERQLNI